MSEQHKTKLFLSYGRRDAAELANRLRGDLEKLGYEVWQDTREIRAGREWEEQIADGLRSTQVVIALLSPHAVRRASDPNSSDNVDSVCLDELTFARFAAPPTPIVPVMAIPCEPPFPVFRLDYVSMTQWMHSEDEYQRGFERLAAGIEAAATGKPLPMRRWHHCLPVLDFAAQLHEKRRDFVGRQWLFDEIDAWIVSSNRERALLVVGDPGIGKSAFVAEMIHRNPDGQVLAYHICRADDPETLRPSTFVMSLAGMIAGRLPAFANLLESPQFQDLFDPKTVSSRPAHVFDQGLIAALHQLPTPTDGIRFVLIDALDEALSLGEGQLNIVSLLSTRLDRLPAWLRIVATTRREPDVLNKLSSMRAAAIDAHRQDNLDDIDRYIEARLQTPNLAERLASSRVPVITVQRKLRDKGDGNFLYVSQALQDIERDNYSFSRLDELPQGLNQWYEAWFERKFPNPKVDFVDARNVLEVILAAREPLTSELIQEMTSLDPHYGLPEAIASLSPFIVELSGCYTFFHKSLPDWISIGMSTYRVSLEAGHQRFIRQVLIHHERHWKLAHNHLLRNALWYARHSECETSWRKVNSSCAFHLARSEAGITKFAIVWRRNPYEPRKSNHRFAQIYADVVGDKEDLSRISSICKSLWEEGFTVRCVPPLLDDLDDYWMHPMFSVSSLPEIAKKLELEDNKSNRDISSLSSDEVDTVIIYTSGDFGNRSVSKLADDYKANGLPVIELYRGNSRLGLHYPSFNDIVLLVQFLKKEQK